MPHAQRSGGGERDQALALTVLYVPYSLALTVLYVPYSEKRRRKERSSWRSYSDCCFCTEAGPSYGSYTFGSLISRLDSTEDGVPLSTEKRRRQERSSWRSRSTRARAPCTPPPLRTLKRERVIYCQPTGRNSLYHRDD